MRADVHSHLLPGIDDGARDVFQTRVALRSLSESGISYLAFTPHFYASEQPLPSFLEKRELAWNAVRDFPETQSLHVTLGAEVYLTEEVFNWEELRSLCYTGTDLMLTELETLDHFTPTMERRLIRLSEDYGITPVLAHIDRYPFLLGDPKLLFHLRCIGCLFQVNLDSFSFFFPRRKLFRLAEDGLIDFFGQDVHHLPITGKARTKLLSAIEKRCGGLMEEADDFARSKIFIS